MSNVGGKESVLLMNLVCLEENGSRPDDLRLALRSTNTDCEAKLPSSPIEFLLFPNDEIVD
jgi:hypothetical protein